MAGDWIKFEKATLDKPEVFEMAGILNLDPDAVIGKLLRVWDWFDDQSCDGYAPVTLAAQLNRNTGCDEFTTAMQQVGWLVVENGRLKIPNFNRHNGQTAKDRSLSAKRMAKSRAKSCGDSVTSSVTKVQPEKRREDKNKKEPQVAISLPFDSDKFRTTWNNWLIHKKEIKQKMPPTTISAQLAKCAKWGEEKAIAAIENAIAAKWQGLFEPKAEPPTHRPIHETAPYHNKGNGHRPLWD